MEQIEPSGVGDPGVPGVPVSVEADPEGDVRSRAHRACDALPSCDASWCDASACDLTGDLLALLSEIDACDVGCL